MDDLGVPPFMETSIFASMEMSRANGGESKPANQQRGTICVPSNPLGCWTNNKHHAAGSLEFPISMNEDQQDSKGTQLDPKNSMFWGPILWIPTFWGPNIPKNHPFNIPTSNFATSYSSQKWSNIPTSQLPMTGHSRWQNTIPAGDPPDQRSDAMAVAHRAWSGCI